MRIVLHCPFATDQLSSSLGGAGFEVVAAGSAEALRREIARADALVTAASVYDEAAARGVGAAPALQWVHFASSGVDPLVRFPPPPSVRVTNSAAAWAPTVAEHAVALLLALQRRLPLMQEAKAEGRWTQLQMRPLLASLEVATVVLLGFGAIGRHIAHLLRPFGPRIVAVARSDGAHEDVERVIPVPALDAVLGEADALVMALPAAPSTLRLVDARRLALLPARAVLVNVGRGETVDEAALAEALRAGRLAGAGLDVFEREPLAAESPLWRLPNVILSPHVAGMGRSRLFDRIASSCTDNAIRLSRGQPLTGTVDLRAPPAARSRAGGASH